MKLKIILILLFSLNCLNAYAADCHETAMTQYDMNICSFSDANKADVELERVYKILVSKNKDDSYFIDMLNKSKRTWVKFKDAQMKMKYPPREGYYYGSVQPMCNNIYHQQLTENRIADELNLQETAEDQRKSVITKYETNRRALLDYKNADTELNRLYNNILIANKDDKTLVAAVSKSQHKWIEYKVAQVEVECPSNRYYGAFHLICENIYYRELTEHRIFELKEWLDGEEEGDVCGGSVPIKEETTKGINNTA